MTAIPVIDLAPYSLSVPADDVDSKVLQEIAEELCKAFTTVGFVYLKNHGIPQKVVSLDIMIIFFYNYLLLLFIKFINLFNYFISY